MDKKRRKLEVLSLFFLITLNIFAWIIVYDLRNDYLEVVFFDVGQGDAVFIETPQKHQILIDGGPNAKIMEKLSKEMPFYDKKIDLVILTHPEKDHLSGLIDVLKNYKVDNVLWTGVKRKTDEYKEWIDLLDKEKANIFLARKGMRIKANDVFFDIIHPLELLKGKELENSNDTSIVSRLTFYQNSFLFTGDISGLVEKNLALSQEIIRSNVLKVSHHGSKTSSIPQFIVAVFPDIAVISNGKNNRYGHPHKQVLEFFEKYGIPVLRTDVKGDIKLFSNGEKMFVKL